MQLGPWRVTCPSTKGLALHSLSGTVYPSGLRQHRQAACLREPNKPRKGPDLPIRCQSSAGSHRAGGGDTQAPSGDKPKRYAVIGAGFAGVSTSWHLLAQASPVAPVAVDLYDCKGLGAGGSGAAAGLLHPFTPRGKVLWKGVEGVEAALELVGIAEQHCTAGEPGFVWRDGLIRPAKTAKHAKDFGEFLKGADQWGGAATVSSKEARDLVPGLSLQDLQEDLSKQGGAEPVAESPGVAGFHVPQGLVLHSKRYLSALWRACEHCAATAGGASSANLILKQVDSVEQLCQEAAPTQYNGIVITAGAAAGVIQELEGKLPLQLSQGYTVDLRPKEGEPGHPPAAPSVLGSVYISMQDGGTTAVVGATRQYGFTPRQSLAELDRQITDAAEVRGACDELLPAAASSLPALNSSWEVASVRTGVRALPPRTSQGSIALAGRFSEGSGGRPSCWVFVGLGARGLVYHALMGRWVAEAMVADDPSLLPEEVQAWQQSS